MYKYRKLIAAAVPLGLLLTGCSGDVPASALKWETNATVESRYTDKYNESESPATIAETMNVDFKETEVIYNETTTETTSSDTEMQTTKISETEAETDPYITIEKFTNLSLEQAGKIFENAGIPYTVINENSKYKSGTVFSFNYYGYEKDGTYRIRPDKGVVLHVSLGQPQQTGENAKRSADDMTVYLTFDDGPTPRGTPDILASLEKYNAKATFFLVGTFCEYYPDLVRQIYESGNTIGCHSYNHDYYSIYKNADTMRDDLEKWEAVITKILGQLPEYKIYRFPGGSNTTLIEDGTFDELIGVLIEKGYNSYDWTMANNDKYLRSKPSEQPLEDFFKESFVSLLDTCNKTTHPRISLMHDTVPETVSTLDWVLSYLTENGYTFGTLDELSDGWIF